MSATNVPARRLVFITGASSGLGQALAQHYHVRGYRLALVARRTEQLLAWAQSLGMNTDDYGVYGADVTQSDGIIAAAQACLTSQGLPDVVIACAGISIGVDSAQRADLDIMTLTYATNNVGTAATFHPFIQAMRNRGSGTLVGLGSVNGIRGFAGHGANCASKAALISYCESLRCELKDSGVDVVTLCPGYIDTPLTQRNQYFMPFLMSSDAFADRAYRAIAAGRSYCVIPWQMGIVAKVLRLMPNRLFDRMFAGRARKPRRSEI